MGIINVKRAIIILLMIGVIALVAGCARWPEGPGPGPEETEYQLEITVEVKGQIDSYEGIYYMVLDADGKPATGPTGDILPWDDSYYYIKLEDGFFYFAKTEEDFGTYDGEISGDRKSYQVTIALSDLGDPNSVDINVATTDSEGNNYDHLDSYFTISTDWGSVQNKIDSSDDSGEGGPDFDIVSVKAEITTLY
jgi:hypothetical protein